jgi:hypothetical protein
MLLINVPREETNKGKLLGREAKAGISSFN